MYILCIYYVYIMYILCIYYVILNGWHKASYPVILKINLNLIHYKNILDCIDKIDTFYP